MAKVDKMAKVKNEKAVYTGPVKAKMASPFVYLNGKRYEAEKGVFTFTQEEVKKLQAHGHKVEVVGEGVVADDIDL